MQDQRTRGFLSIAVKYGLMLGVLLFGVFLLGTRISTRQGAIARIVNIAFVVVLMVLAQREFKRIHGGIMRYGQGIGSGTALTSTAAVLEAILMYSYLKFVNGGYLATVIQAQRTALQQRGLTGAQAQQAMAITAIFSTPAGIAIAALITGVIAGFIIALIVSIFTQKEDPRAVV